MVLISLSEESCKRLQAERQIARTTGGRRMKHASSALALVLALGWAATASAEEMKAEVIHWWTSGGESAAVKVFADQFNKAGGTWVDTAIAGGSNARTAAINRTV